MKWGKRRISNGVVFLVFILSFLLGLTLVLISVELKILNLPEIKLEQSEKSKDKRKNK